MSFCIEKNGEKESVEIEETYTCTEGTIDHISAIHYNEPYETSAIMESRPNDMLALSEDKSIYMKMEILQKLPDTWLECTSKKDADNKITRTFFEMQRVQNNAS